MCCGAVMLMRCVVARAVCEFLFEPKSRSGGRSATASDFENKPKTCKKHDLGPSMRVPSDAHRESQTVTDQSGFSVQV